MLELDEIAGLHRDGKSSGEVLVAMKERGLTIVEAIKTSMQLFNIGLGDAKALVTAHPSWSYAAEGARPLQDDLIRISRDAGDIVAQPKSLATPTDQQLVEP